MVRISVPSFASTRVANDKDGPELSLNRARGRLSMAAAKQDIRLIADPRATRYSSVVRHPLARRRYRSSWR
jgi:hypothetical protein